eukprot:CAMPEP_0172316002 /NCGR_PEP_ID=MMETSP1058-20130122/26937_1 /TAXON_ID=83371 /ORGANISM="Detonula confervacea, Strain CCMP 353" /LENGTH=152 /DNA_ID=CAMNT_0013030219 /DNA_START=62 /DNA_END=520 /DNA_ORIENTATION=+
MDSPHAKRQKKSPSKNVSKPPKAAKLLVRAKKAKGGKVSYKKLEELCYDIQSNASWSQNHKDAAVLLDATEALSMLHVGYENRQAKTPWCFFSGEEDDWGSDSGRSIANAWLEMTKHELVNADMVELVSNMNTNELDYYGELFKEWTDKDLL